MATLTLPSATATIPAPQPWATPNVLAAVGERRDDPDHLLLLGDDGRYYDLHLTDGATIPLPPDPGDEWLLDPAPESATLDLLG